MDKIKLRIANYLFEVKFVFIERISGHPLNFVWELPLYWLLVWVEKGVLIRILFEATDVEIAVQSI